MFDKMYYLEMQPVEVKTDNNALYIGCKSCYIDISSNHCIFVTILKGIHSVWTNKQKKYGKNYIACLVKILCQSPAGTTEGDYSVCRCPSV